MTVANAVAAIRKRVDDACVRSGRNRDEVTIVAVAKGRPASDIQAVVEAGIGDVALSKAQELRDRSAEVEVPRWHFVGGVQTNKVRYLDDVVLIHGVDRIEEVAALNRRGESIDRTFKACIEVNVSGEESKQGISAEALSGFVDDAIQYGRVKLRGLMFVAPAAKRPEDIRWAFETARRLRDRVRDAGIEDLSMGMSDDFEIAVEEGATLVRIGRAIFQEV